MYVKGGRNATLSCPEAAREEIGSYYVADNDLLFAGEESVALLNLRRSPQSVLFPFKSNFPPDRLPEQLYSVKLRRTAGLFLNRFNYLVSYRKGIASPTSRKRRKCSIITQPVFSVSVVQATTLPSWSKLKSKIS
jgi:hypothetical protein